MEEVNLSEFRASCLASICSISPNMRKYYCNPGEMRKECDRLKGFVLEYCKLDKEEDVTRKAILKYEKAEEIGQWQTMKNEYMKTLADAKKKNSRHDKHPYVRQFENAMKDAESLPGTSEIEQDSEADLAITETVDTYIDPVHKKPITNPVRNKICKHVYDKETADSIIKNVKNNGCPCFGCTNRQPMRAEHLVLDKYILDKIQTQQASQEMEEDGDSD